MIPDSAHIGLIAGGRNLPLYVAEAVKQRGLPLTIIEIDPDCPAGRFEDSRRLPLVKFGKILKHLQKTGVTHVCMAGRVGRPDFGSFKPDVSAMRYLPGTIKAARAGDDALLRHVMGIFEANGFQILPAQTLCESLLLPEGSLGSVGLSAAHRSDAEQAMKIASLIGKADIGQGAIVAKGVVLAVEAQEGTDAMLDRVATLPAALCGTYSSRAGVLAKRLKPDQDRRVDLPTLGPNTVQLAAEAGLAGIIADAGEAFVIDREETVRLANHYGMFIVGLPKQSRRDAA